MCHPPRLPGLPPFTGKVAPPCPAATIAAPAAMIGAMPAVAVRHERRKQKGKSTASSILGLQKGGPGGGGARPNALLLKPHLSKTAAGVGGGAHHAPSANASRWVGG